jgi:hypothetical protein
MLRVVDEGIVGPPCGPRLGRCAEGFGRLRDDDPLEAIVEVEIGQDWLGRPPLGRPATVVSRPDDEGFEIDAARNASLLMGARDHRTRTAASWPALPNP